MVYVQQKGTSGASLYNRSITSDKLMYMDAQKNFSQVASMYVNIGDGVKKRTP